MAIQSEQVLEEQLLTLLQKIGYKYVLINNESNLLINLKAQLEKHNNISLSETEFEKVMNLLSKGSVFEKAKTLRQKQHIVRDNGDNLYFEFLNTEKWCQNQYQVTNQVTIDGKYKNKNVTLYRLHDGTSDVVKIKAKAMDDAPIEVGDMIKTLECAEERKWGKGADGFYMKDETEVVLKKLVHVR